MMKKYFSSFCKLLIIMASTSSQFQMTWGGLGLLITGGRIVSWAYLPQA